jgi:hypothetical protein
MIVGCLEDYLTRRFPESADLDHLLERIAALRERVTEMDAIHEQWMSDDGTDESQNPPSDDEDPHTN